jgi:hypothetical protein
MQYIENSEAITGYRVGLMRRKAFRVTGYTLIVPPHGDELIPKFWNDVAGDGRLDRLKRASTLPPWLFGVGSWDPECEKHGQRYTFCIEENPYTDFSELAQAGSLYSMEIGASEWLCFEMPHTVNMERFWQDDPFKMMKKLGYRFNAGDFSLGLHIDAYPPLFHPEHNPMMSFWITVTPRR